MSASNTYQPVLVTGATGYVAGVLVKHLVEQGCTVHATVRDMKNKKKLEYLQRIHEEGPGNIHFFEADLLAPGTFKEAMLGCSIVFHTASPFIFQVDDVENDLLLPAEEGTAAVLNQACQSPSVKRVVLTSSIGAMCGDLCDYKYKKGIITESDWNTTSNAAHQPYFFSKTIAEKKAWSIAQSQSQWDMISINPSLVLGPGISPYGTSESFRFMKKFGDGSYRTGVPNFNLGVVDVRDVARAHIAAAFKSSAKGRYLVVGHNTSLMEIAEILRRLYGDAYPFPKRILPKALAWLFGPVVDHTLSRKIVSRNVGYSCSADNRKSRMDLKLNYHPLEDTLSAFFDQIMQALP